MEQHCNYMALVTDIFNSLFLLLCLISLPLYFSLSFILPPPPVLCPYLFVSASLGLIQSVLISVTFYLVYCR